MKITRNHAAPAALIVVGFLLTSAARANDDKVTICHKGKEISVSGRSVDAHVLHHGDTVGPCSVPRDATCTCFTREEIAAAFEIALAEGFEIDCGAGDWVRLQDDLSFLGGASFLNGANGQFTFIDIGHSAQAGESPSAFCEIDAAPGADVGLEDSLVVDPTYEEVLACNDAIAGLCRSLGR